MIYQDGAEYYVLEAVQPVRMISLQSFIDRGEKNITSSRD